jgi:hypothetical protein
MLKGLDEIGRKNWMTHTKHVLYQYGFGFVWIAGEIGDARMFLNAFTQRLKDCAKQTMHSDINTSPKALSYRLFKSALTPGSYISLPLTYNLKRALSNFRCSCHGLMIEKGRHLKINREFRFCKYCLNRDRYIVEDEMHFLLICPLYHDLRQRHFKNDWLEMIICERTFIHIMSDDRRESVFAKAKFIENGLKLRASTPDFTL